MGRRRQAIKDVLMTFCFCYTIIVYVVVIAVSMVMLLPISLIWLISPTLGDKIICYATESLLRLMDHGSKWDVW